MSCTLAQRLLLAVGLLLVFCAPASADVGDAPRPESPYFFVKSSDPALDPLPLKSTKVDVRISGVIANVTVTQHYRNEGQRAIEARYVFPGSTGAAVHALRVRLGERLIEARIRERQQARSEYEKAKSEGRTTALLEQERPNVFAMNVGNILPNDDVMVELQYTELIAPSERKYQFVFPTVVGPRYTGFGSASSDPARNTAFPATPYHPAGIASSVKFELDVRFDSPLPVSDIASTSHTIRQNGVGRRVRVRLDDSRPADDRDFILDYRLAGERTASGLKLYQGTEENFFLAIVEPPKIIRPADISPRDYVFVVDISGSMHGFPLDTAKELLRNLIGGLKPSDTFNVMLFAGSNRMLHESSVPATFENVQAALLMLNRQAGGGGTELVPALRRIVALPKTPEVSRTVIVVTDGYVSVENEVFALIRRNLGTANLFAFGIGSSVNRHLIEGMARAGQGESFVVTQPQEAARQAERLRSMIEAPVLTRLQASFTGIDAYEVEPAVLPDVLGGRPVVVMGKWRPVKPGKTIASLTISGHQASGPWKQIVSTSGADSDAIELQKLWARSRIRQLSDEEALNGNAEMKPAITRLGLQYSLLTQYTSFIAVDRVVRREGPLTTVDQPSPMPAGVGNSAIGAEVPGTPEPSTWLALLTVMALLLTGWRARFQVAGRVI